MVAVVLIQSVSSACPRFSLTVQWNPLICHAFVQQSEVFTISYLQYDQEADQDWNDKQTCGAGIANVVTQTTD